MQLEESRYIVIAFDVKIVHSCARFRWFVAAPYFGLAQCPDSYLMWQEGDFGLLSFIANVWSERIFICGLILLYSRFNSCHKTCCLSQWF
jgi:hypothetical protein